MWYKPLSCDQKCIRRSVLLRTGRRVYMYIYVSLKIIYHTSWGAVAFKSASAGTHCSALEQRSCGCTVDRNVRQCIRTVAFDSASYIYALRSTVHPQERIAPHWSQASFKAHGMPEVICEARHATFGPLVACESRFFCFIIIIFLKKNVRLGAGHARRDSCCGVQRFSLVSSTSLTKPLMPVHLLSKLNLWTPTN